MPLYASDSAATPGRTLPKNEGYNLALRKSATHNLPSRSSKEAPPPVETWLTLSSVPHFAQQVAVSPENSELTTCSKRLRD